MCLRKFVFLLAIIVSHRRGSRYDNVVRRSHRRRSFARSLGKTGSACRASRSYCILIGETLPPRASSFFRRPSINFNSPIVEHGDVQTFLFAERRKMQTVRDRCPRNAAESSRADFRRGASRTEKVANSRKDCDRDTDRTRTPRTVFIGKRVIDCDSTLTDLSETRSC